MRTIWMIFDPTSDYPLEARAYTSRERAEHEIPRLGPAWTAHPEARAIELVEEGEWAEHTGKAYTQAGEGGS